jgi:hypothetical protein
MGTSASNPTGWIGVTPPAVQAARVEVLCGTPREVFMAPGRRNYNAEIVQWFQRPAQKICRNV